MAVVVAQVYTGVEWIQLWTVTVTDDASQGAVITPVGNTILPATPVAVSLVPLSVLFYTSMWRIEFSALAPPTFAGFSIAKDNGVGTEGPLPQVMVVVLAPPPLRLAHP
jgi:hypothetical protein